ncbi:glutamyl-tRNA amidotransferase [Candidatus Kaiserbacteria bacterium CG10_big_fil_rev_8_21_14_0_10_45_20]|uniref:Glutamyl-tRNA amidotransferase n=1 Tax=Candidatus Kaiserbacteria bacterium CG10_big_fil_rev_8_21_14_0_10_45_20 TaxID=1974607 RepID=A0A2H0UIF6_9BACT|nr:MAG: glutamyl-tRNA amidotransferase [Candidatus Kaiserbacteria bacterium CG10_big_fil_rev_8_21_14_0_10_45_20]
MLHTQIKGEVHTAMKERDVLRVEVLRGLSASFTNELVATKRKPTEELSDEEVILVIRREVKKRKESAEAFKAGNRPELAEKEEKEIEILNAYLPALMNEADVRRIVETKKAELGISEKKDIGRLMGAVMKELAGKADGDTVKKIVEEVV